MAGTVVTKERTYGLHIVVIDETGETEEFHIWDDGYVLRSSPDSHAFAVDFEGCDNPFQAVLDAALVCGYKQDVTPDTLQLIIFARIAAGSVRPLDEVAFHVPQDEEALADDTIAALTPQGFAAVRQIKAETVLLGKVKTNG